MENFDRVNGHLELDDILSKTFDQAFDGNFDRVNSL
jgi:hypothetical protein